MATTTNHPDPVKELLKRAGMSERSELDESQVKQAAELASEETKLTGERLAKAIKNGRPSKAQVKKKYPDAVLALHAEVVAVCDKGEVKKHVVPKQTQAVSKALGDTDPTEALGLSANALKEYALNGKRPKDTETLKSFISSHKNLKNDANLGPRKVAVVAYAASKQNS